MNVLLYYNGMDVNLMVVMLLKLKLIVDSMGGGLRDYFCVFRAVLNYRSIYSSISLVSSLRFSL